MTPVFEAGVASDRPSASRVRVPGRARTYVHPLGHAEPQLRGHRVRPPRPVSRSSAPRDVQTQQRTRFASHTSACRVNYRRDSRRGTRGRERSDPKSASRPIDATEFGRFGAAATTSGPSRSASFVARRGDGARAHIPSSGNRFLNQPNKSVRDSMFESTPCLLRGVFEPAGQLWRAPPERVTDRTHGHGRASWRASCRCPTGR